MVERFKHTEVGVIPSDWDVKTLGECLLRNPDYGINAAAVPYNENLPVYLRITDITEDGNYSKKNLVSVNNISSSSYFLQEGDLVFARTGASVGKTYLYNPKDGKLVFAGFLIRVRANKELLLPNYLKYFTKTKRYWDWIAANSMRTGQPGINGNEYKVLQLPLPPLPEQTAIATALNDADALIQKLEQLIAKKRNIKTGAMQELLKPKEGWKWTTVEKLGKPYGGLSGKAKADFKDVNCPYIPFMNIMSNPIIDTTYFDYVKIAPSENQNRVEKGDLFFNGSSETPEEVGMCSVLLEDIPNLYLNSFCFGFRLFKEEKNDGLYLAYFFRSSYGRKIFYILSQGATRHNLSKSNFLKIEIQIPEPDEQKKIATILRDMDMEIQELEKQLEKYKMLKQGMMQSLLTGKIRLN
jgi:type I restriction enzyme S subunit